MIHTMGIMYIFKIEVQRFCLESIGKRGLTLDQQQYIRKMFAAYGYPEDVVFDRYEKQYDF